MHIIEKLRTVRSRFGGGMDGLSRSEQVEILWRAWAFAAACALLACIGTLIVTVAHLIEIIA